MINPDILNNPRIYIRYDCTECKGTGIIGGADCLSCVKGSKGRSTSLETLKELLDIIEEDD